MRSRASCTEMSKWADQMHRLIKTLQKRVSAWTLLLWAPGLRGGSCAPAYLSRIDHLSGGKYIPEGGLHRHRKVIMNLILRLPSSYILSAVGMSDAGKNETYISSWASIFSQKLTVSCLDPAFRLSRNLNEQWEWCLHIQLCILELRQDNSANEGCYWKHSLKWNLWMPFSWGGGNNLLQHTYKEALFLLCSYEFMIRCHCLSIWKGDDEWKD